MKSAMTHSAVFTLSPVISIIIFITRSYLLRDVVFVLMRLNDKQPVSDDLCPVASCLHKQALQRPIESQ